MVEQMLSAQIDTITSWLGSNPHDPEYCLKYQKREQLKLKLLRMKNNNDTRHKKS